MNGSVTKQTIIFVATSIAMLGTFYVYDSIGPVAELLSRQLGFSDAQIGTLNAVYSLPNIPLVFVGGILVDRYGARSVTLATAIICLVGALLTAVDGRFATMVVGRLLFGIGAENLVVAIYVGLSHWFAGRYFALLLGLNLSLTRLGSYLADRSPSFAHSLYDQGWQPPLWFAVVFAVVALLGAIVYWMVDRNEAGTSVRAPAHEPVNFHDLLRLPRQFWYLTAICVAFYSSIIPFRSTFAIKYFQEAHELTLETASRLNSYVFLAAVVATPVFGLLVDRVGRHALLMRLGSLLLACSFLILTFSQVDLSLPTVLLGISFSLLPAVLWQAVPRYIQPAQRGIAYGLMAALQNLGMTLGNLIAGYLNDRGAAGPGHPEGYTAMLMFFSLLSVAGLVFAELLKRCHEGAYTREPMGTDSARSEI